MNLSRRCRALIASLWASVISVLRVDNGPLKGLPTFVVVVTGISESEEDYDTGGGVRSRDNGGGDAGSGSSSSSSTSILGSSSSLSKSISEILFRILFIII
ncbi:hypothetical protein Tco_1052470 [Tanacetum coccineum]